jgi:hypothetical protein
MLYYLDYLSSFFCVAGVFWFLFIIIGKVLPLIIKKSGEEKIQKWQIRILLTGIPASFLFSSLLFYFSDLDQFMRIV